MTKNANFKRRVRSRAAKTGESYTTARTHLLTKDPEIPLSASTGLRLAVAQTAVPSDPRDRKSLRENGHEIRCLMRDAHGRGAKLILFPEGATCSPNKRLMSSTGPQNLGPADWNRFEWAVLREELNRTRKLAGELGLWTVIGAVHPLTHPHWPHNSLYVFSDRGALVTRYDERMLSNTKLSFMYTPGAAPITFEIAGLLFGCALGMECHFPEIFLEYERLNVDCVLFSTTGGATSDPAFSTEVRGMRLPIATGLHSRYRPSTAWPPLQASRIRRVRGPLNAPATGGPHWLWPRSTKTPRTLRGRGGGQLAPVYISPISRMEISAAMIAATFSAQACGECPVADTSQRA